MSRCTDSDCCWLSATSDPSSLTRYIFKICDVYEKEEKLQCNITITILTFDMILITVRIIRIY